MAKRKKKVYRILSFSGGILPGKFSSKKKAQEARKALRDWGSRSKIIEG
jgi:hypothetical protein